MTDAAFVMKNESSVDKGENARLSSFVGAIAIADLVKSTLGPKGMDKILQSVSDKGKIEITNDGATILKSLHVSNAAAKVLIDISKVQDDEVGDGTTSVVVLAGELLRQAEILIRDRVHPMTIIDGWRLAADAARQALVASATRSQDSQEKLYNDLLRIAMTTLSSKLLNKDKTRFAKLAVDAVLRLKGKPNLDLIQVIKIEGGSLEKSYLDEGFLLQKKFGVGQPKRVENARILVSNTSMDHDKIKIYGSRVKVESLEGVAQIEEEEKMKMKRKVEKIKASGANVFVNRQLVYNYPEMLFAEAGIAAIEHADFEGVERLSAVTGAETASTFDNPESLVLGRAALVEEVMIGEERLIRFSGLDAGEACSIVLRGASSHVLDEAERSLHDALAVLVTTVSEPRITRGGGCAEMIMAKAIDELAPSVQGKKSLAVESFATALRALVAAIADNGGYDSAELVASLRKAHHEGKANAGLDMENGTVGDMEELGVLESFKLKEHVLLSASEAAELIIRVDEIVQSAPRKREGM